MAMPLSASSRFWWRRFRGRSPRQGSGKLSAERSQDFRQHFGQYFRIDEGVSQRDRTNARSDNRSSFDARIPRKNRRLLARRQLSIGRPDLSLRQSFAEAAADAGGREAHAA